MDIQSLQLAPALANDLRRWVKQIGKEDPYKSDNALGIFDVLKAHYLIANFFLSEGEGLGGIGPRDLNLLHSALYRQHVGYDSFQKWEDIFDICATLMFGLIKDHPFYDANKRTAFLSALYYLYEHSYTPIVTHKDFENFTVDIANNKLRRYRRYKTLIKEGEYEPEVIIVSRYLRKNSRKVDKRHYTVTYRQLNKLLKRFDCYLDNPQGNFIDVVKCVKKRKLVKFRRKYVREPERVAQIGFPGWSKQVNQGAIKTVRKKTGLTPENGVDSQTFFKGLDTVEELIAHYREPLKRLAKR